MAATNSQVAKRSLGDSGISAAGFLSGPEESGCSLSNWITGLFLISKGCELSRGLAWWNQSGSWNRREEKQQEFLESLLASAKQLMREMQNQWSLLRRDTGVSFQWHEFRERSPSEGEEDHPQNRNNLQYQNTFWVKITREQLTATPLFMTTFSQMRTRAMAQRGVEVEPIPSNTLW